MIKVPVIYNYKSNVLSLGITPELLKEIKDDSDESKTQGISDIVIESTDTITAIIRMDNNSDVNKFFESLSAIANTFADTCDILMNKKLLINPKVLAMKASKVKGSITTNPNQGTTIEIGGKGDDEEEPQRKIRPVEHPEPGEVVTPPREEKEEQAEEANSFRKVEEQHRRVVPREPSEQRRPRSARLGVRPSHEQRQEYEGE